jgi:FkbM family methyltransferase
MMLERWRRPQKLKRLYRRLRGTFGANDSPYSKILARLRRQQKWDPSSRTTSFQFPWGRFDYANIWHLTSQFEEIFVKRCYAFQTETLDPVIFDCGGNIGLTATWFKLSYPTCHLTVYEPDPDLARILETNLHRAGFRNVQTHRKAVWTENKLISFCKTGDDKGHIALDGTVTYPAIDLSEELPACVDLLKLDVEGAEFEILKKLCATAAIQRVRRLICEFHVWRDRTDAFLQALSDLRKSGMNLTITGDAVPWIGLADESAPFDVINKNHALIMAYAWRPCEPSRR